jgi:hypothetical protein
MTKATRGSRRSWLPRQREDKIMSIERVIVIGLLVLLFIFVANRVI